MMALPRPGDVDVAEFHSEVASVVAIVDIEGTMVVTVEDSEVVIVVDSEEANVASEATEVANEAESVVCICLYLIVTHN